MMIYETDKWLEPWKSVIDSRRRNIGFRRNSLAGPDGRLTTKMNNHLYYGLHRTADGWVFREYAPNATKMWLIGDFNNWKRNPSWELRPIGKGDWEIRIPSGFIFDKQLYKLYMEWPGGGGERIPSYAIRCVQDPETKVFCAQVWRPRQPYVWKNDRTLVRKNPFIYECHIGMATRQ